MRIGELRLDFYVGAGGYVSSMQTPHPWRRLRSAPHITLRWHKGGPMGWCRHTTQEISLRTDLDQSERRAVLTHELVHLELGPAIVGFEVAEERGVCERAARWLIPFDALVDALVWANDDQEVASILWVDIYTVQTRLTTLTPAESNELNRRLDKAELTFPK